MGSWWASRRVAMGRDGQTGVSLVEVLLASSLMVVVLVAILGAADSFGQRTRDNTDLTTRQEAARGAVERITRELRSAVPQGDGSAPIVRLDEHQLVFAQGAADGLTHQVVRYCLAADGRLVREVHASAEAALATCGAADDGSQTLADGVAPGRLFQATLGAGLTLGVQVQMALDGSGSRADLRPLRSSVSIRNRALGPDDLRCEPAPGGLANGGLLSVDVGANLGLAALVVEVAPGDLLGLNTLLFGGPSGPAGGSGEWGCTQP